MKKLYILLLIALISATCLSLPEDYETLIKQITSEEQDLQNIEHEIAFYSSITQQRKKAREFNLSGESRKLENLFREQEAQIAEINPKQDQAEYDKRILALGFIFKEFPSYQDDILYYRALAYQADNNTSASLDALSQLITQYPSSNRYTTAAMMAARLYFESGDFASYIDIVTTNRLATGNTLIQYNLGNAYYNEGFYDEAKTLFNQLSADGEFGFRAQALLALITYDQEGIDAALSAFTQLQNNYPPETPHYSFVIVSLARLYDEHGDHERAMLYYAQYAAMEKDAIDDELLYEIGVRFALDDDYATAKDYCIKVLAKDKFSDYTIPARVLAYALDLEMESPEEFEKNVTQFIEHNDAILNTLREKRALLDDYNRTINSASTADTVISNLENSIVTTNELLKEMYVGRHDDKVDIMLLLENEYFYYINTLNNIDQVIALAQNQKNNRIPEIIEREIAAIDTNLVSLEFIKIYMLSPEMTPGDIALAQELAQTKRVEASRKKEWLDLEAIHADDPQQAAIARIQASLTQADIDALDVLSRYYFQMYQNDEVEQLIDNEIAAMEQSKQEYRSLQGDIAENFNKRIARYMGKERDVLAAEFVEVQNTYDSLIQTFTDDVVGQNQQYQMEMLDVLFKYSLKKDEQYQQYQKELVHE